MEKKRDYARLKDSTGDLGGVDSWVITFLRFPLAVLVVCIHAFNGHGNILIVSISQVLSQIAVPIFFAFSGYLFFTNLRQWNAHIWFIKVKKRFLSLCIPYLLWILIYVLWSNAPLILHADNKIQCLREIISIDIFWSSKVLYLDAGHIMSCPALVPMWFIRDLMVTILCSPLIYAFMRSGKRNKTAGARRFMFLTVLFIVFILPTSEVIPGFNGDALFFFCIGSFFKLNDISFGDRIWKYRKYLVLIAIVTFVLDSYGVYYNIDVGFFIHPIWILSGMSSIINFCSLIYMKSKTLVTCSITAWLAPSSFFIFASHMFILPYLRFFNNYFIKVGLTILICTSLYFILKRFLPRTSMILNGRK